jgi:hypothetical protein
MGRNK